MRSTPLTRRRRSAARWCACTGWPAPATPPPAASPSPCCKPPRRCATPTPVRATACPAGAGRQQQRRQRQARHLPRRHRRPEHLRLLRAGGQRVVGPLRLLVLLRAGQPLLPQPVSEQHAAGEHAGHRRPRVLPRRAVRLRRHRGQLVPRGHRDLDRGRGLRRHQRQRLLPAACRCAARPASSTSAAAASTSTDGAWEVLPVPHRAQPEGRRRPAGAGAPDCGVAPTRSREGPTRPTWSRCAERSRPPAGTSASRSRRTPRPTATRAVPTTRARPTSTPPPWWPARSASAAPSWTLRRTGRFDHLTSRTFRVMPKRGLKSPKWRVRLCLTCRPPSAARRRR